MAFKFRTFWKSKEAQINTLEGIIAATIMIGVLVFAVQATSLTPLTSSTANAHVEAQLNSIGQDIMTSLDHSAYKQDSNLKKAVIGWNGDQYVWNSTHYVSTDDENLTLSGSVQEILEFTVTENGIAHNLQYTFTTLDGDIRTESYIYNGDPSDNAVIISRKVLISNTDLTNATAFSSDTGIPDVDAATDFYNIIDVKLTMWRM
ncbi:hypothetical protein J2755_001981 [Methanohalophilus levihalophilus]|uniref:DUF7288 family protein n=1 Tax=Methanohalophilus levihalophilus TaxID=1431282 RepID=UPI001FD969FF|nr:hypothetical protein [Methanohalophilus levihalophilus]MBP2031033.1 hypothetical protein [Methanohalophilus levihalophilus]